MKALSQYLLITVSLAAVTLTTACTGQSTNKLYSNNLVVKNVSNIPPDTALVIGKNILRILQDKDETLWFATDGEGLYRYDGVTLLKLTTKHGLPDNYIRAMAGDDNGNLWFTTREGIVCSYNHSTLTKYGARDSVELNSKTSSDWKLDNKGTWFGTGNIYCFDGQSVQYLHLPKTSIDSEYYARLMYTHISPYGVYTMYKDSKGNMWFGTEYLGVCKYDGNGFTWFNELNLGGSAVRCITEDTHGNMWFGNSITGLFKWDGKQLIDFTKEKGLSNPDLLIKPRDKTGISPIGTMASIHSLAVDDAGDLWIGTFDAGVWRYDGKNLINYNTRHGLGTNSVTTIIKDKNGKLWFGTYGEGLYTFNGKSFERLSL